MINRKNVFILVCTLGVCDLLLVNTGDQLSPINLTLNIICFVIFSVFLVLIVSTNNQKIKHNPIDIGKAIECGLSPNLIDSFKIVENHLSKHVPDSFAIFESNVVIWSNIGMEVTYLLSYCKDGRIVLLAGKVASGTDEASGLPCQTTDFRTPIFCIPFNSERTWEFVKIMKILIK